MGSNVRLSIGFEAKSRLIMMLLWRGVAAVPLIFLLVLLALPGTVNASVEYNLQAGAYGDEASQRNMGVRVEIQTRVDERGRKR